MKTKPIKCAITITEYRDKPKACDMVVVSMESKSYTVDLQFRKDDKAAFYDSFKRVCRAMRRYQNK